MLYIFVQEAVLSWEFLGVGYSHESAIQYSDISDATCWTFQQEICNRISI